jgi:hypothetical protein
MNMFVLGVITTYMIINICIVILVIIHEWKEKNNLDIKKLLLGIFLSLPLLIKYIVYEE